MWITLTSVTMIWGSLGIAGSPSSVAAQEVTQKQLDETLAAWKQSYVDILLQTQEYMACEPIEAKEVKQRWRELKAEGDRLRDLYAAQITDFVLQADTLDPESQSVLYYFCRKRFETARYEESLKIAQALLKHRPENKEILKFAVDSAYNGNEFPVALELLSNWKERTKTELPYRLPALEALLPQVINDWQQELALREKEAQADDLPQIELETNRGTIVIELYEDQAPQAVRFFVSLCVGGFYQTRQLAFFEVVQHRYARTGCLNNDGTSVLKMGVESEAQTPTARKHFRGAVTMLVAEPTNLVRSQFAILRSPQPQMDGRNVVIGRVIEGMEIADRLLPTRVEGPRGGLKEIEDVTPDHIVNIKIRRLREHDYQPRLVQESDNAQ